MPNYVPYLILAIISIVLLTFTIVHQRQFGITVLLLGFTGMVYVAEFIVMIIGNSYVYFPEVLSIPYYDNALGAIVSNLFVIPVLGVVAAVYQLRLRWLILFAGMLTAVDWLYEWLNVYHTNWWRREYTFLAVLSLLLLAKFWMRALQKGTKWSRFLTVWMQGWGVAGTVMYIMSVADIRHYEYGVFNDFYRNDLFISAIMGMIKGLIIVVGVMYFRKSRWRLFTIFTPVVVYGIDLPLYYSGLLVVEIPFWIYTIVYLIIATLLFWWSVYAYSTICSISDDVSAKNRL